MRRTLRKILVWFKLRLDGPYDISGYYPARYPFVVVIQTNDGFVHHKYFEKDRIYDSRQLGMFGDISFYSAKMKAHDYASKIRQEGFHAEYEYADLVKHYPITLITDIKVVPYND